MARATTMERVGAAVVVLVMLLFAWTAPGRSERRVSEEALIFRRLRGGVCTVYGDDGQGTGFLVDSMGVVLTNDHVVGNSRRIRVKFDDTTKVEAVVLSTDPKKDVCVLRVHPDAVRGYPILAIAAESDTMVFEGEKAMAMGSPLNQEKIMTVGIISKVEPTALISDVNINHGNSGGPLVNMNGEVIAINTFGDFTSQGGPGVSGSIRIGEAQAVLAEARNMMDAKSLPGAKRLPVISRVPFPLDSLFVVSGYESFKQGPYEISSQVGTGKFIVTAVTPVYDAWRNHRYEMELSKKSRKRESKGGVSNEAGTDPRRQMREWMRYTGSDYAAVVTIQMSPKMGQTAGSIFGNILGAAAAGYSGSSYRGAYRYEYKADFLRAELSRGGEVVEDINMFRSMIPAVFASADWNGTYTMEDQARTGILQLRPEVFAPEDNGNWPEMHMRIWSVEKPEKPYEFDLPEDTVKRIWGDFAAWRDAVALKASH